MENFTVKVPVNVNVEVDAKTVDYLMIGATEGGVNYWCDDIEQVGDSPTGDEVNQFMEDWTTNVDNFGCKHCSAVLLLGGRIYFHDMDEDWDESNEEYTLTLDKLVKGIKLYLKNKRTLPVEQEGKVTKLDTGQMDAYDFDSVIQFALFGKEIYG